MRRGQTTLEYTYLIGIVAVAIIAISAYISRGFQGNLRTLSEQVDSGAYAPGNTEANSTEIKHVQSVVVSTSTTTTTYGNGQAESEEMHANSEQQKVLRAELLALKEAAETATGSELDELNQQISDKTEELQALIDEYEALEEEWAERIIIPDSTKTTSSTIENGTQTMTKQANEELGSLGNDSWH